MATVSALSSPFTIYNVTDDVVTGAQGSESGGAIVPGSACYCNCGMTASLNCGTVSLSYYGEPLETLEYRDYWEWVDSGDPLIRSGFYVATLATASASAGCEPTVNILVDTNQSGGFYFHSITVDTAGLGTLYVYYEVEGSTNPEEAATRPGVVIGSAAGDYGDIADGFYATVEKSVPVEWRPTV